MSFSAGGGVEGLEYFIKAYDMATPVFKAFGAEVEATTRKIQGALTEMNRAMATQSRTVGESAASQSKNLRLIQKGYESEAAAAKAAAEASVAANRKSGASAEASAAATRKASESSVVANRKSTASTEASAAASSRAAASQRRSAVETEAAFGRAGSSISKVGRNIAATAIVAAGASVDMASKFQANTLRMETQAGATAKQLDQIRQGLLKMAGDVGSTPNQLASGMYHVVSSMNQVIPKAQRVSVELDIMRAAAQGAQIGHSNLEETTYALASAMNALHDSSHDAKKVMGELNATVGSGDMNMQDLIDAYKSGLVPTAREFGTSLASVNSALAVMGDMGMRGALAGTRLRMALSLMGAPTKQAAGILEALGLSSKEAISRVKGFDQALGQSGVHLTRLTQDLRKPDGIRVALSDLNHQLRASGTTADGAAAVISRAFGGGRMGAAIALLAENTGRLGLKFDYINSKASNFGKDWAVTQASFRVQVDKALASLEAFGIVVGNALLPYATKAIHALEDTANWFLKNKAALEALGIVVVTFSTITIGSYLIGKLEKAVKLMKELGGGMSRMGQWLVGGAGGIRSPLTPEAAAAGPAPATLGVRQVSGMAPGVGGVSSASSAGIIFGYMGSMIRVGTMMNPIAVIMSGGKGGAAGAAQMESAASTTAVMDPATKKSMQESSDAISKAANASVVGGVPIKDPKVQKILAQADAAIAKADIASVGGMSGRARWPAGDPMGRGGQVMSATDQAKISAAAAGVAKSAEELNVELAAGVASVRELNAADQLAADNISQQATMWHTTGKDRVPSIMRTGLDPNAEVFTGGYSHPGTYLFDNPGQTARYSSQYNRPMSMLRATVPPGHPMSPDPLQSGYYGDPQGNVLRGAYYTPKGIPPENITPVTNMEKEKLIAQTQNLDQQVTRLDAAMAKAAEGVTLSGNELVDSLAKTSVKLQEESLFGTGPLHTTGGRAARLGEQMSFGDVATGATGARGIGGMTSAEQRLAEEARAAQLRQEEQLLAGGGPFSRARERTPGFLSGLRGSLSDVGGTLMRGGTIAGMGVLASQMAGSMIGGKTGDTVSHIGTAASIGGGLGSLATLIPGVGPIVGPLVGAIGGGLVAGLDKLFKSPSYGTKIADTLSKGFGGQHADALKKSTADALDNAKAINDTKTPQVLTLADARRQAAHDLAMGGAPSVTTGMSSGLHPVAIQTVTNTQLTPEQIQKREGDYQKAGRGIATALERGWNQYKFQSEPIMFQQLRTEIKGLPPQAQAVAIESAIKFSSGLESKGRLTKNSTQMLLDNAKSVLPGFEKYLGLSAQSSVQAFIKNFDFSNAEANLKNTLDKMRGDFPEVVQAMDSTTGSIEDKSRAAIKALRNIQEIGTKPMKEQAKKDLADLVQSAGKSFGQLADEAQTNSKKFKNAVASNSDQAFQIGSHNFAALAKNIAGAIGAGAEATQKGLQNITDMVNKQLKGFGEGQLSTATIKALSPGQLAGVLSGQISAGSVADTGGGNPGHAIGGLVKTPSYVVGEEAPHHPEYILATNPAYRQRNLGLWAQAGQHLGVPGFRQGGVGNTGSGGSFPYQYPIPGFSLGRVDQGVDAGAAVGTPIGAIGDSVLTNVIQGWYAGQPLMDFRLLDGPDAGRFWYVAEQITPVTERLGSRFKKGQAVAHFAGHGTGIEMGWAADASGTTLARATTGYSEGQATPAGRNFVQFIEGLAHGKITGGGAFGGVGATWNNLKAPTVPGDGTIPAIVRGALTRVTNAANKFGQAAAAKAANAGGIPNIGNIGGGDVKRQMLEAGLKLGINKIGVAGMIGNAVQESSLRPNYIDAGNAGLFSWAPSRDLLGPAAQAHQPWQSVAFQMALAAHTIGAGGIAALNKSGSPGAAAAWFEQNFEKAGIVAMGNRIAGANQAFAQGFAKGGVPGYAGAFGDGGGFTATKPTLALFGDKGPESVVAIPHYATGGVSTKTTTRDTPKGQYTYVTVTSTTIEGGEKVTTRKTTETTPSGAHDTTTTVSTSPIAAPKPHHHHHHTTKRSTHYNPITNRVETHTPDEWAKIHAQHAKETHDAAAHKKKFNEFMQQQIAITLSAGGIDVGSFDESRKAVLKDFGDIMGKGRRSGTVNVFGAVDKLSANSFKKLVTQFNSGEKALTVDQAMTVASTGAASLSRGPDRGLFHHQGQLEHKLDKIHTKLSALHEKIAHHHHESHADRVHIASLLKDMHKTSRSLNKVQTKIADSRPAQIENAAINNALTGIKSLFGHQQDQYTRNQNVAQLLQSIPSGATAKSLGLSKLQLKASGLTSKEVASMAGGADPVGFLDQIDQLTKQAIPEFQSDAKKINTLYKAALKTHNKKLQASLLAQLDAITQAQLKAQADLQAAQISEIDAIAKTAGDSVSKANNTSTMIQRIQGYAPGTGLFGINAAAANTLGINAGMEGISNPVQMALQQDQPLVSARSADVIALNRIQDLLSRGGLSADAQREAVSQMQTLGANVMDLTDAINHNLTAAIDANTTALTASASQQQNSSDIVTAVENLAPGTSLADLGFDPTSSNFLSGLEGTGLNYLQRIQQQSGITGYTPEQIQSATQGVNTSNWFLRGQINTLMYGTAANSVTGAPAIPGLLDDQRMLPTLTGSAYADMYTTIQGLLRSILGLNDAMNQNNQSLQDLTSATKANTTATGSMTGSVGYSYQSQDYLAGSPMSSDSSINVGLGL